MKRLTDVSPTRLQQLKLLRMKVLTIVTFSLLMRIQYSLSSKRSIGTPQTQME